MDNIDIEDLITEEIDVLEEAIQYVDCGAVNSVNGKTGDVILNASDVGAATQQDINRSIETKQDKLVSSINIKTINNQSILGSGNITIQAGGAVNSVNGKTGDVTLKTADLENNSDYQTGTEVSNAIATHNESNTSHNDIRQALNAKADQADVDDITDLIPSQATVSNQLADKAFVNNIVGDIETLLNNLISGGGAE